MTEFPKGIHATMPQGDQLYFDVVECGNDRAWIVPMWWQLPVHPEFPLLSDAERNLDPSHLQS